MQRFFDILFSGIAIIVLSPLLIVISGILKFTGEGEIFYVQQRVGLNGVFFGLLKFATMLKDSSTMAMGTVTVKDDPRVLPLGKFLRKSKINELPQLFNIFLGDMSVIGPRPQAKRCFDAFPERSQIAIKKVKPGLSGIGSIVFRDEEDILHDHEIDRLEFYDNVIAPYKGELEEWYVENHNLYTYFMLIGLTVWVIVFSSGTTYKKIFPNLPAAPKELEDVV